MGGSHSWAQHGFGAAGSGSYSSMFVEGYDKPVGEPPTNDTSTTDDQGPWPRNDRHDAYEYESKCYMTYEDSHSQGSYGSDWAEGLRRAAFTPPTPPKHTTDRDTY